MFCWSNKKLNDSNKKAGNLTTWQRNWKLMNESSPAGRKNFFFDGEKIQKLQLNQAKEEILFADLNCEVKCVLEWKASLKNLFYFFINFNLETLWYVQTLKNFLHLKMYEMKLNFMAKMW